MTEFVIYQHSGRYELYIEREEQEMLDKFSLSTTDKISNYPNLSRVEGNAQMDFANKSWLSYYKGVMQDDYSVYDKGQCNVLETNDKFMKVDFNGDKISDVWLLRKGENDRVLFWKPIECNDKFSCPCDQVRLEKGDEGVIEEEDKFSLPVTMQSKNFSGTMVAAGVWEGQQKRKMLYTNELISKLYDKYHDKAEEIKVDYNHDEREIGNVQKIEFMDKPVHRLFVEGEVREEVPAVQALSIDGLFKLVWNDEFNIHVLKDVDIKRVALLDVAPGCKICYLK